MATTYCTYTELAALTGSSYTQATLEAIINHCERKIDARLASAGLTGSANDVLKSATLDLSKAEYMSRRRIDGTRPASIAAGAKSTSDSIDAEIKRLTDSCWALVDSYIKANDTENNSGYHVVLTNE